MSSQKLLMRLSWSDMVGEFSRVRAGLVGSLSVERCKMQMQKPKVGCNGNAKTLRDTRASIRFQWFYGMLVSLFGVLSGTSAMTASQPSAAPFAPRRRVLQWSQPRRTALRLVLRCYVIKSVTGYPCSPGASRGFTVLCLDGPSPVARQVLGTPVTGHRGQAAASSTAPVNKAFHHNVNISTTLRIMSSEEATHPLAESGVTIRSDSEQYSGPEDLSTSPSPSSSPSPAVILYQPPTIWSIFRGAAINLFLPFINGMMLGFGELFAHEAAFRLGWSSTRVSWSIHAIIRSAF